MWLLQKRNDASPETRDDLERLLEIGKLVKKRYEFKVTLLLLAAQALARLGEEERARRALRDAPRFYDQQLSWQAEGRYPSQRVVQMGRLKEHLEEQLGPAPVERVTCMLTAETEEDLRLALDALESGAGVWKLPRSFRRVGRQVQARVTLTLGEQD